MWWETLREHAIVQRDVAGRQISFYVEKTKPKFAYALTINDVCHLLSLIPTTDWEGLSTFVFRQPTSKQVLLKPVWGRIDYYAELFAPGEAPHPGAPAIFLEAVNITRSIKWSKHLGPDDQKELQRLSSDGHDIRYSSKSVIIKSSYDSVRSTQLYRTFLHEIGHWVDYCARVERLSVKHEYADLLDLFWARPEKEREAVAHRYADSIRQKLLSANSIPFERIFDHKEVNDEILFASFAT